MKEINMKKKHEHKGFNPNCTACCQNAILNFEKAMMDAAKKEGISYPQYLRYFGNLLLKKADEEEKVLNLINEL